MANRFKYLQSPLMMNALCPIEKDISEDVDLDTAIQEAREFAVKQQCECTGYLYHNGGCYRLKQGNLYSA